MYVQAIIAINLQKVGNLLGAEQSWAYIIYADDVINRDDSYIDDHMHVDLSATIRNIHIIAIPVTKAHTGSTIFDIISHLLGALFGRY